MTPTERAKQLTESHWNGYIKPLLLVHGTDDASLEIIGFHYLSSGQHFYGHAIEDERNGMFWEEKVADEYIDHVALESELDRSCGDAAADAEHASRTKALFTRGCPTCLDAAACAKNMGTDSTGKCLYHRLHRTTGGIVKDITSTSLCYTCQRNKGCIGDYPRMKDGGCEGYIPEAKQDTPTAAEQLLDFVLPPIVLRCTAEQAREKYESEVDEWRQTKVGSMEEMVERWDCLQALRTYYERGGVVAYYQAESRAVMEDLTDYFAKGWRVMTAKAECLLKNAKRGYYAPEVNAAIIASNGASFTP